MSKLVIGRIQLPDGRGGWSDEHGYRLISTNRIPSVHENSFDYHADAVKAAGREFAKVDSELQARNLWAESEHEVEKSANSRLIERRGAAVSRFVNFAVDLNGPYFLKKVILCDENGDLPMELQPLCSVLVIKEGESRVIDTLPTELLAAEVAKFLNKLENFKSEPSGGNLGRSGRSGPGSPGRA